MAKMIPLTQGKVAVVDDADFDWLNRYKWFAIVSPDKNLWYAYRGAKGHGISMHRFILGLHRDDGIKASHCNHNGLDNRRSNLKCIGYFMSPIINKEIKDG